MRILKRLHWQCGLLAALGLCDLFSTLWLLQTRQAAEANPFMALFLARGVGIFLTAKLVFLLVPLLFLEWARKRAPVFVGRAARAAVLAYVGFYLCGVASANIAPYFQRAYDPNDAIQSRLWARTQQLMEQHRRQVERDAERGLPDADLPDSGRPASDPTESAILPTVI